MHSFNEELLQFIWRHKLLRAGPYTTHSGKELAILKYGELNLDSGPDFFNAQIRIDGLTLAGNIEIHIRTSDWLRHGHQRDKTYDTIILHAVYEHDEELQQNVSNNVEILELKNLIADETLKAYTHLQAAKEKLPCSSQIQKVPEIKFLSWMERMTIERLEEKVKRIEQLFQTFEGDYTQTFYTCLLRNFGFKVNALPFELLARQLPVQILLKHSDNVLQLEALLFGVSGMLEDQYQDKYIRELQNEFEHLKNKYKLSPLKKEVFKFSKLRPANFPNVRLAQFARLIYMNPALLASPQKFTSYKDLMKELTIEPQGYWQTHYQLDGELQKKKLSFGKDSAENLLINTFAPFFFFYSKRLAKPDYTNYTLELLSSCKSEDNIKTRLFSLRKQSFENAAFSQASIYLYDNYCTLRKCLKCGIAASILNPA